MGQKLGRQSSLLDGHKESKTPAGNPLPYEIHAELSAEQLGTRRVICVGDVHGCADELQILLRKCRYQKDEDFLVFNGDMINKGPKSVQVIDVIRSMDAADAVAVRGNQDDKALAAYVQWKAGEPLDEQLRWLEHLGDERAEWLRQLPFSLSIPSLNLLVVHAGLIPGIPLKQQSLKTLTELRELPENLSQIVSEAQAVASSPDSSQEAVSAAPAAEPPVSDDQAQVPWASLWKGPQHVVFGHDASRKLQTWPCATGLDTGCCYGGQLTALIIPRQSPVSAGEVGSDGEHCSVAEADDSSRRKQVPSLSDLDASLVLVPAKQAYSKKK